MIIDVFFDAETYYDPPRYSLRTMPTADYVRDDRFELFGWAAAVGDRPFKWYDFNNFQMFLVKLRQLAEKGDHTVRFIAHNTRFDGTILTMRHLWTYPKTIYACTLSMARAVVGPRVKAHSLKYLARYFDLEDKGDTENVVLKGKRWDDHTPEQQQAIIDYALHDGHLAREVWKELRPLMPDEEMDVLDWVLRMMLDPRLDLSVDACQEVIEEEHNKHDVAWGNYLNTFEEYYDENPAFAVQEMRDVRSRVKFAKMLKQLGAEPPMKKSKTRSKRTGNFEMTYAFAKDDYEFVAMQDHENPVVGALVSAKLACTSTALLRRAERMLKQAEYQAEMSAMPNQYRHCWPVPLNYSGALNTHRLSGGDLLNAQNFSKKGGIRATIVPRPGWKVWAADLSGIELRVAMWLMQATEVMDAIANKKDAYIGFATEIYGEQVLKLPDDHPDYQFHADRRTVGKVGMLSLQYGTGWQTFRHTVWSWTGMFISAQEAKSAVAVYRHRYPANHIWKLCEKEIILGISLKQRDQDYTETPLSFAPFCSVSAAGLLLPNGLRLHYPNMKKRKRKMPDGKERNSWSYTNLTRGGVTYIYGGMAFENLCQALARIIVVEHTMKIDKHYPVSLSVHDECVGVEPEKRAHEALAFALESMRVSPDWWPEIVLDADGGVGDNYKTAKK